MSTSTRKLATIAATVASVLGAVAFLAWADLFATQVTRTVQSTFSFTAPLAALVGLVVAAMWAQDRPGLKPVFVLLSAAFVITLGFTVKFWWTHGYDVDREYVSAIEIVETDAPTFDERVSHPVAKASARNSMQDVTGDLQSTRYVATEGSWNALVNKRTRWYEGSYEVVQVQNLALAGTNRAPEFCSFSEQADRRVGGPFGHSLARAIAHQARGAFFDDGDVYGLCDGDRPVVVVPLKRLEGWFHAHEVPAGVAVYDGHTGEIEVLDEVEPGQLAGPVYPMSLAQRTREAAVSLGTWAERKRTGYDTNTEANSSEFALASTDGQGYYVTALTPRGDSNSIVATSTVASDQVSAGKLNTLQIHRLKETRVSNSTMDKTVRADYSDLEWAAGLDLYEITPVSPTEWVASLGMEQKVKYRVYIKANGDSCLQAADGRELRCSTDASTGTSNNDGTVPSGTVGIDSLGDLTDEQLIELQSQVTREVLRRVNPSQG